MKELADMGYTIHNANTGWCYYVIREDKKGGDIMDKTRRYCNASNIFENWNPRNCANRKTNEKLIPEENYAGSYFAVWADNPDYKDENQVWDDTYYRTWANSAVMWGGEDMENMSYDQFREYVDTIGTFPGYSGDPSGKCSLPDYGEVVSQISFIDRIIGFFKGLLG